MSKLLPFEQALERLVALAEPVDAEDVPAAHAGGRWARADVIARGGQPFADLSAMDGYAIRFADLPGPWTVIGEAAAGTALDRPVGPGQAARIFTGAPVPDGADTVLIQEEAARENDRLILTGEGPPHIGRHIRRAGSNFSDGAVLVATGERLSPARVALAVLGGHGTVTVNRRIKVVILSSGDELVAPGVPATGARINASNGPMLAAMLAHLPVDIEDRGIVPDTMDALRDAFTAARDADLLVTSGGASVGDHDLVRPALEAAGATIDFWRIAMRPGKPLMAGRMGRTAVIGLPGNPVSAFVTARLFAEPMIAALAGSGTASTLPFLTGTLGAAMPANGPRTNFVRATMQENRLFPIDNQDSAALSALAMADALIVRPPDAPAAKPGDSAEFLSIA